MEARFHKSIRELDASDWQALWSSDNPFIHYHFLQSLEGSGATLSSTGWTPHHLSVWQNDTLVAAMPLYIKTHSYGEYVFDWSWADAYHQYGCDYYPKLLNAIPFTPSTGPRLALSKLLSESDKSTAIKTMCDAISQAIAMLNASSFHSLFPDRASQYLIEKMQHTAMCTHPRLGTQFHWLNNNYRDFDAFLLSFTSRKRKSVRRERQKICDSGVEVRLSDATEISPNIWAQFYELYHLTYFKRSGRGGYLNLDFFMRLAKTMPQQTLMVQAYKNNELIAAALYFRDNETLYGRYWGSREDIDGLHFECCYYQGIEYAIAHKLQRFDPGAQGEHKIQRGFTPLLTCSYHIIADKQFYLAINDFVHREQAQVRQYAKDAASYLPFKNTRADEKPLNESTIDVQPDDQLAQLLLT